jgi:hypothetical protein
MIHNKTIIRVTAKGLDRKFTTFTKACKKMGLPYHYLKRFKLPRQYKEYLIERISVDVE